MATVSYAHIEHDPDGQPIISGTRFKVRMIALDHIAHGRDAEEIQRHHPELTLGQVHSALAYYYDHKDAMDRDIREGHRRAQELRAAQEESPRPRKAGLHAGTLRAAPDFDEPLPDDFWAGSP